MLPEIHDAPRGAVRAELRANLRLALPLIAAQLAGVGMTTIDTIFAGRLGPQALAAVAVGSNYNVVFFVLFMGLYMGCSPVIAHMVGAQRPAADIGAFIRRALRLAWLGGLLWMVLLDLSAGPVLRGLGLTAGTTDAAILFTHTLSGSGLGLSLWFCLRFSAEGLGKVWPILYAGVAGLLCNVLLDWLLLFGHFGLPRLGAPGCGVATTVSSLVMAGTLYAQFRRVPGLREPLLAVRDGAGQGRFKGDGVRALLRIGTPIGMIFLAEAGLFVLTSLLMARFGDNTVAAYQVAINFASVVFMIPVGVGLATTVRVGHAAGAGEPAAARFRGFVGMGLGLGNAASNAAIMALCGGLIAAFYSEDAAIAGMAAHFLVLAAFFQFFDGLQSTANGALRGIKDTRVPMLITLVSYWLVGLPVAWWLAFRGGMGPDGLWWGLTAGLGAAALGLSLRYRQQADAALRRVGAAGLV